MPETSLHIPNTTKVGYVPLENLLSEIDTFISGVNWKSIPYRGILTRLNKKLNEKKGKDVTLPYIRKALRQRQPEVIELLIICLDDEVKKYRKMYNRLRASAKELETLALKAGGSKE